MTEDPIIDFLKKTDSLKIHAMLFVSFESYAESKFDLYRFQDEFSVITSKEQPVYEVCRRK